MTINQLKLLVETVQQLSLARDIETIMAIVRTSARKLTRAEGATFVLRDQDLCYYADEDAIEPLWKGQRFPMSTCISGWAMLNKQSVHIPDIYKDKRVPIEAYKPTFVKSLAMVPIRTMDPIGAIGNYWAKEHVPSALELELLQSLADITSVSIENVYSYNELKQQNRKLYEIAFLQAHQVRGPVAQIKGLSSLFNFEDSNDPINAQVIPRLKLATESLDEVVHSIVQKTSEIKIEV
jgi:GAF domain-containing protein